MRRWLLDVVVVLVAFLAPIHQLMGLTLVLIIIDLITGIWAAKKRGEPIESKKMAHTVNKLFAYELGLIMGFIVEQYFLDGIPLVKVMSSVVGMVETKSVAENFKDITGIDLLSEFTKKLGRKLDGDKSE